jgi:hypothetical protein
MPGRDLNPGLALQQASALLPAILCTKNIIFQFYIKYLVFFTVKSYEENLQRFSIFFNLFLVHKLLTPTSPPPSSGCIVLKMN